MGETWVGKFTYSVSPMESQKCFAEVPWLVRGNNTQPSCMVTNEITTYEEERVGVMVKSLTMLSETDLNGVNVWKMVQ